MEASRLSSGSRDKSKFPLIFYKKILRIFINFVERERNKQGDQQNEQEKRFPNGQGAQNRAQSQDPGIMIRR